MDKKDERALKRIEEEIQKLDKKENTIFFFVLDTKGVPSGNLQYIYNLAMIANNNGYKVGMLYQTEKDDEFVGVKDWLGEDYANLPHYNIASEDIDVTPSDVLFIPELFSNVMNQTKKLPCKRICILQNYDFLIEQMPFASQIGNFGILETVCNTERNADLIKDIFPYVKTTVIDPYIDKMFGTTKEPKKMIVNIVAPDQEDINRIIKPFYWKFPSFKWVSFRDLRGFTKQQFANGLREAAITIWCDSKTPFGYSALEAIKSGSIVIAKIPEEPLKWMNSDAKNQVGTLTNACIWFDDYHKVQSTIANVVRSWITNNIPQEIGKDAAKVSKLYPYENTEKQFVTYLDGVCQNRRKEMTELIKNIKKN